MSGGCGGAEWTPSDQRKGRFLSPTGFSLRRTFQACDGLVTTAMAVDGRDRLAVTFDFDDGRLGGTFYRRAPR